MDSSITNSYTNNIVRPRISSSNRYNNDMHEIPVQN